MSKRKRKSPQEWRQEVVNGLMINGKSKRTAETYAREVRKFCEWFGHCPRRATEDDLKRFALYRLNECNLASTSMRILCVGLKFFFEQVLHRKWPVLQTMRSKHVTTLSSVLTIEEVWRVLGAVRHLRNRTYLQAGVDIYALQQYLGHATIQTTIRYLHLTVVAQKDYYKIIDDLMKGDRK